MQTNKSHLIGLDRISYLLSAHRFQLAYHHHHVSWPFYYEIKLCNIIFSTVKHPIRIVTCYLVSQLNSTFTIYKTWDIITKVNTSTFVWTNVLDFFRISERWGVGVNQLPNNLNHLFSSNKLNHLTKVNINHTSFT